MKIEYYDLRRVNEKIEGEIKNSFFEVLNDSIYILGKQCRGFEEDFAEYIGVTCCIGVDNGLDALQIILSALDLPAGSEVLVPANTFIATALAASYAGLKVVLVEPDYDTLLIDPERIEEKITENTRVIMPVHLCGASCDMDRIMKIAEKHNLYIVEDNAQAQGCIYKGRKTGSFGIAAGTSFYPGKNIGALGDAGAITTSDDKLACKMRKLINYGSAVKYHHEYKGFNARLDEIQAAVLKVKLAYLDGWNKQRQGIAAYYKANIHSDLFKLPSQGPDESVWHIFAVRVQDGRRDELMEYLKCNGIGTNIHYPIPIAEQQAYCNDIDAKEYPIASRLSRQVLSLPIYPYMEKEELQYVCDVLNNWK